MGEKPKININYNISADEINKDDSEEYAKVMMPILREEILENQKAHTQILRFKLAVVSIIITFITYWQLNPDKIHNSYSILLFLIPPFIAICFDLILNGHRNATRRIGEYTEKYLEKELIKDPKFPRWENHVSNNRFGVGITGNFGITLIVAAPATYSFISNLWIPVTPAWLIIIFSGLMILLFCSLCFDYLVFMHTHMGRDLGKWEKLLPKSNKKMNILVIGDISTFDKLKENIIKFKYEKVESVSINDDYIEEVKNLKPGLVIITQLNAETSAADVSKKIRALCDIPIMLLISNKNVPNKSLQLHKDAVILSLPIEQNELKYSKGKLILVIKDNLSKL